MSSLHRGKRSWPPIAAALGLARDVARKRAGQRLRHRLEAEHPRGCHLLGTERLFGRYGAMQKFFNRCASQTSAAAGHPLTFAVAISAVLIWGATGSLFNYSNTWQLVINTGTTIITFLMVFLIQNSQNRDAAAMQAKLDELLRAVDKAREQFIGIEHLTDHQIQLIRSALERHAKNQAGKQKTADDTVDRLLDRF